jgi:hypothetical protein
MAHARRPFSARPLMLDLVYLAAGLAVLFGFGLYAAALRKL